MVLGSMGVARNVINQTICDWGNQNIFINSRFAIIVFGLDYYLPKTKYMEVITDFTNASDACDFFTQYLIGLVQGRI